MKKIEEYETKDTAGRSPEEIFVEECIANKLNEVIFRLNQSVSQPEDKTVNVDGNDEQHDGLPEPIMRETIKPGFGDTELAFHKGDKNFLESIVENNTEEWKKVESEDWKAILTRYYSDISDNTIVKRGGKIRNLIEFIEQILSEKEDELQDVLGTITVADSRIRELEKQLRKVNKYFEEYESDYLTDMEEIQQAQKLKEEIDRLLSSESN